MQIYETVLYSLAVRKPQVFYPDSLGRLTTYTSYSIQADQEALQGALRLAYSLALPFLPDRRCRVASKAFTVGVAVSNSQAPGTSLVG